MPPKSAEERTVDVVTHRDDREESVSSEATLGRGSEATTLALSPENLTANTSCEQPDCLGS